MAYRTTSLGAGIEVTAGMPASIQAFTVFFRFRRTGTGGTDNPKLWRLKNTNQLNDYEVGYLTSNSQFFIFNIPSNSYSGFSTSTPVQTNVWYDCAILQSGSGAGTLKLYWAETRVGNFASVTATGTAAGTWGTPGRMWYLYTPSSGFGQQWADAALDNIKCWNVALSDAELEQERAVRRVVRTADLRHHLPTLTTVVNDLNIDYSGNGNNGVLYTGGNGITIIDGAPTPYGVDPLTQ